MGDSLKVKEFLVRRHFKFPMHGYFCYLLSFMLKPTTFIHYELIIINAKCGARAYANCIVVRALRLRR